MSNTEIAKQVIDAIGGVENVSSVAHCATRLRVMVKDEGKIDKNTVENLEKVQGAFFNSGQYQIIFGTGTVNKIYDEVVALGLPTSSKDDMKAEAAKQTQMPPDRPPSEAAHNATHHSWHTEPYFVPPCILDFYFENRLLFNICSQCIQRCLHSGAAQQMLLLLGGGRIAKRIRYGYSWYHTVYANRLGNRKKVAHKYNRETCAPKFFYHR